MLDIRLSAEAEEQLARHARDEGRMQSALVCAWIMERLEQEHLNEMIRNATQLDAADRKQLVVRLACEATEAHMRWLDAEDGGYDWRPQSPPKAS